MITNKGGIIRILQSLGGVGGGGSGKSDYELTEILPGHSPVRLGDK